MNIETFIQAFSTNSSGCVRECKCGRKFYDNQNAYDWEKGELEALQKDKFAKPLDYSAGTLFIAGVEYAIDCDCWYDKAKDLMGYLDKYAHCIAAYLNLEKERKLKEAAAMPEVK